MTAATATAAKKTSPSEEPVLFKQLKPGDIAFLLMPSDQKDYERVIEKLSELHVTEDSLPKVRKEISLERLTRNNVIYTACCPVTKRSLKKQPIEWSLKISGPYRIEAYLSSNEATDEDEVLDQGRLVDAIVKGVHPTQCVKVSNDKHLKLLNV